MITYRSEPGWTVLFRDIWARLLQGTDSLREAKAIKIIDKSLSDYK